MRADLHLHSVCSDGKYSPAEIARRAKKSGLSLFSLTDHDTMEGCAEAAREANILGIKFLRGWEISAYERGCKTHILGYGCRENEAYFAFLRERAEGALVRAREMTRLANMFYGLDVTADEIEAYHVRKNSPLHTMHVVRAFAHRLGRDPSAVYVEAFVRGRAAFSEECRPTPEEAIDVIHASGGKAVLAHPGRILVLSEEETSIYYGKEKETRAILQQESDIRRRALAERLAEYGLDGIECYYTTHTAKETERFLSFARGRGLLVTGGSDFHAEGGAARVGFPLFEAEESDLLPLMRGE